MSTQANIHDIQLINYTILLAIHASVHADPANACYQFSLSPEGLTTFKNMSLGQIQAIVANLDVCLFEPRWSLFNIFDAPPGLAGILAAVSQPNALPPSGLQNERIKQKIFAI